MIRGLYALARLLGDVQAIRRGRYGARLYNRWVARSVLRAARPFFLRRR